MQRRGDIAERGELIVVAVERGECRAVLHIQARDSIAVAVDRCNARVIADIESF